MSTARVVHNRRETFDVLVDRTSDWGNPFTLDGVDNDIARAAVVADYRWWLLHQPQLLRRLGELSSKVLGCWCKWPVCSCEERGELYRVEGDHYDRCRRCELHTQQRICHADLLKRLANPPTIDQVAIVTGWRHYTGPAVREALADLAPSMVLHGASPLKADFRGRRQRVMSHASIDARLPFCGADGLVERAAGDLGIPVFRFHPWTGRWGKNAYTMRNAAMVAYGAFLRERAAEITVLAFPHPDESRGTYHTISKARQEGLAIKIQEVTGE